MLDRLLKPTVNGSAKDQSSIRRSMKRPRDETSPVEVKSEIVSTPAKMPNTHSATNGTDKGHAAVKAEPVTPSVANDVEMKEFDDDLDFSMLDDAENQFNEQTADTTTSTSVDSKVKTEQIKADLLKKENENYAKLLFNWENNFSDEKDDDDELLGSIDVDGTQASITNTVDGKSSMKFWYWDAYEDPIKLPGKIFLFGKMVSDQNPKEFKSVCITVENVNRCLYLLPRKYVSISDFYFFCNQLSFTFF